MGALITVKSKDYTFLLDGKRIYLKMPGLLNQRYLVEKSYNEKRMPDEDFMLLVDSIYRHKIHDTNSFNNHVYKLYKLSPTSKRF